MVRNYRSRTGKREDEAVEEAIFHLYSVHGRLRSHAFTLSREFMADELNWPPTILDLLMSGKRNPTRDEVFALSWGLGCRLDDIERLLAAAGFSPVTLEDKMRRIDPNVTGLKSC
jgi:hypothetical protein